MDTAVIDTPVTSAPDSGAPAGGEAVTESSLLNDVSSIWTGGGEESAPVEEALAPEVADDTEQQAEATETTTEDAPAGEYQLNEDGSAYIVPKTDWSNIASAREYATKVQEKFPTVQDAEIAANIASNMRHMTSDFLSGDQPSLERFFNYLSGADVDPNYPDLKAQYSHAFTNMMMKAPEALQRSNPQAYDEFIDTVTQPLIDGAYAHAAETGKAEDFKGAQWFEYQLRGQYKTELPKPPDPAQQAQGQLGTREQQIAQREQYLMDQSWKTFDPEPAKWSSFYSELDRTLAPVKANYDESIWPMIRKGIAEETVAAMKKDFLWTRDHQNALRGLRQSFDQRWKAGKGHEDLAQSVKAFQNDFLLRARKAIPSVAKTILEKATAKPAAAKTAVKPAQNGQASQKPQTQRAANGQYTRAQRDAQISKTLDDLTAIF